jgi:hypothetical protein
MPGILLATNVIKPLTPIDVSAPHHSKQLPRRCASNPIAGHKQHGQPSPLVHSNKTSHNRP